MRLTDEQIKEKGAMGFVIPGGCRIILSSEIDNLFDTIEALRQEIDSLQKCYDMTNESWKKLKQENEQLRIDLASMGQMVADYNTALDDIERLQQNYNALDNGHHKLFMAYSEQRKALRKAREALELIYKKHTDIPNHNRYPKTCVVCGEALAAIDSAIKDVK